MCACERVCVGEGLNTFNMAIVKGHMLWYWHFRAISIRFERLGKPQPRLTTSPHWVGEALQ